MMNLYQAMKIVSALRHKIPGITKADIDMAFTVIARRRTEAHERNCGSKILDDALEVLKDRGICC